METHLQLHQIDVPEIRRRTRQPRRHPPPRHSSHRIRPLRLHLRSPRQVPPPPQPHAPPFTRRPIRLPRYPPTGRRPSTSPRSHASSSPPRSTAPPPLSALSSTDSSQILGDWFRSPDVAPSSFDITHRKIFWDLIVERLQLNRIFNSAMESDSTFVMDIVTHVAREDFRGIGSLIDVGGGTGLAASKLVEAFPNLRCIVFDLRHVIAKAPRASAAIEFVSGDMFVEVPRADAALLKVKTLYFLQNNFTLLLFALFLVDTS
ncbi:hypothetical protein HPP92_023850 [Vanilla planifolia]|uniref:O-methyltransferase C-terminal domain-containing protein n=1 Tax=Vanilla planifolia TaxID=51239 RepID=A0A835PKX0_VANPL|nr:hypothetical protein HPP92_023850 [Vanilla planifolia]